VRTVNVKNPEPITRTSQLDEVLFNGLNSDWPTTKDFLTWLAECGYHVVADLPLTEAVERGVECFHGSARACISYRCGSNCDNRFDRMHPCPACLIAEIHDLRATSAERAALVEEIQSLLDDLRRYSKGGDLFDPGNQNHVSVGLVAIRLRAALAASKKSGGSDG
jgi:hypothetical protein